MNLDAPSLGLILTLASTAALASAVRWRVRTVSLSRRIIGPKASGEWETWPEGRAPWAGKTDTY